MNASRPTPRVRLTAVVLTALGPGFGQVYARDYRAALCLPVVWLAASALPGLLAPHIPWLAAWILPVSAVWLLGLWWVLALHAGWSVGRHRGPRRKGVELLFLALWLGMWAGQSWLRTHVGGPVASRSATMGPNLGAGELFYASRLVGSLERGQVVLVRVDGRERLGRVVGVPGDRIALQKGVLAVEGESVVSGQQDAQWWTEECDAQSGLLPLETHGGHNIPVVPGEGSRAEGLLGPDQWWVLPDDRSALDQGPEPVSASEVTGVVFGVLSWTNPCGLGLGPVFAR